MTRDYVARCLLALGPLTFRDFVAITGWPAREARNVLKNLKRRSMACCVNHRQYTLWSLA